MMGAPVLFITGDCFLACRNPKIPMIPEVEPFPGAEFAGAVLVEERAFLSSATSPCPCAGADPDSTATPLALALVLALVLVLAIAANGFICELALAAVVAVAVAAVAPLTAVDDLTGCA